MSNSYLKFFFIFYSSLFLLAGCGFRLQGEAHLAAPLHKMYLQTPDPYGQLERSLQQYLKLSKVQLVSSPQEASTLLIIHRDDTSQDLLSVSGTQQTRQYTLKVTVTFEVTDKNGRTLIGPQSLAEVRNITVQSNRVLGSSNEASLFYQQMRRSLAYAIINIIASKQSSRVLEKFNIENMPSP